MARLAILVAVLTSVQVLLGSGSARAAEERPSFDLSDEVRGLVVIKLPFGGPKTFSAPRLGFDFQMRHQSDLDRLKDSYDPVTGRRLPEIDTGRMRTWSLDPPEFVLPDEEQGEPEILGPGDESHHLG